MLLVANHSNSLVDPAVLIDVIPRPVHFGAKHTLFKGLFRPVLEAFGAIPIVRAQDDRKAMGRNAGAFERFKRSFEMAASPHLSEGLSQVDPHLAPFKQPGLLASRFTRKPRRVSIFMLQSSRSACSSSRTRSSEETCSFGSASRS